MGTGIVDRLGPPNHCQVFPRPEELRVGVHLSYGDSELDVLKESNSVCPGWHG